MICSAKSGSGLGLVVSKKKEIQVHMKTVIALVFFGFVILGFGTCVVSTRNTMVRHENGIKAQYEQNQNSFSSMTNKVREMSQVPEMYAADLEKLTKTAIEGRYGEGGSKAVMQFIQEHNPTLDPSMYTRIQQAIESSRTQFATEQKTLLDKKMVYQNTLDTFPENMVSGMFGFPRIDLDKYGIVINQETEDAFRTKKAEPMRLRSTAK
jgi:hypothetical protein